MAQEIERYRKPTRVLHLIHGIAFTVLFLTGLILFIPQLGILAQDGWTRLLHRIAAVLFVVAPLIYIPLNWKSTLKGIKDAFTWGIDDIGWLRAAPQYYFLCDEEAMPPQPHMNSGQKLWWLMVIICGVVFLITGLIMWFFKGIAPPTLLQWMVFVHDIAFIAAGAMFFVHIYLGVIHPLMRYKPTGAWTWLRSFVNIGIVPVEYAKSHYAKWYEGLSKTQKAVEK